MPSNHQTKTLLEKQEQQFIKNFEQLTLLLTTVGRQKPQIQSIASKQLNLLLQFSHTWKDDYKNGKLCGRNVKLFRIDDNFILAHVPLIYISSRNCIKVEAFFNTKDSDNGSVTKSTIAPVVSAVSAESRLNSNLSSLWAVSRLPSTEISSITVIKHFSNYPRVIHTFKFPFQEVGTFENPVINNCTREDIEVLIEFHLLNDARAAVDAEKYSSNSLKIVLEPFVCSGNFKEYKFNGFSCFFGSGNDEFAGSMIYLPDRTEQTTWSIYEGDLLMPKRIYVTARSVDRLDRLLKFLDWPYGVTLEIRSS